MKQETEFERSTLHTKSMMGWFQSRHSNTTKDTYTFLPDQTHYVKILMELFREFDKNYSNSLDKEELYNLFTKYEIQLTKEELYSYFSLVDKNHDRSLSLEEFKLCVSDKVANKYFSSMMEQIRQRQHFTSQTAAIKVRPLLTFKKVLNQITYLEKREQTIDNLYNNKELMTTRVKFMKQLLGLNNQVEVQLHCKPQIKNKTIPIHSRKSSDIKKEIIQIVNQAKETGMEAAQADIIHLNYEALSEKPKSLNLQSQFKMSQSSTKFHKIDASSPRIFMHPRKIKETSEVESLNNELNQGLNELTRSRRSKPLNYIINKEEQFIFKELFQNSRKKIELASVIKYLNLEQYRQIHKNRSVIKFVNNL